ncbi:MAG TPA: hypothetical protein VEF05_14890 [Terriglobales bacterium]|nr:hypothetical protein [Terriglobales bacterium]
MNFIGPALVVTEITWLREQGHSHTVINPARIAPNSLKPNVVGEMHKFHCQVEAGNKRSFKMKVDCFGLKSVAILLLFILAGLNPAHLWAVPSYARQTGLACSGCHYNPPELNPAGRRFKLLGYVDRGDQIPVVKSDAAKEHAPLDLLASLPLSVMLEASFTSLKSPIPTTQNGNFEFPQDISLFLSGAWTTHVGSFVQVTYDTQDDHFTSDNTDIRYANKTKAGGKELVWGLDLNNNPTVEDLWNSTPAWGFPWVASDFAPTPAAAPIIDGGLAQDVAGFGAYAMWNNHLYLDFAGYRSEHVGPFQPNPGTGAGINIRGLAPYWRAAWQSGTATTQWEIGTYGMHFQSTPNAITGPEDAYTDWAVDTQIDQTLFRRDVLSFRATYIHEKTDLLASFASGASSLRNNHLDTVLANAEWHFGNRSSATFGWFDTSGTVNPLFYAPAAVSGSANGNPRSDGYIVNFSYWPWQNLQLAAQYTGYTRFNGAGTNYDGAGRNASANNTIYLDAKFLF